MVLRNRYGISKITLGSVQLGLRYGINSSGQPTEDETLEILEYAFANGLNAIDTCPSYGDSERRIGKFIRGTDARALFVITKLEAQDFPEEIWGDRRALSEKIQRELDFSCWRLNLRTAPAYIVHFADEAFRDGGIILDELVKRKDHILAVGTSLYTGDELERCIDDERIDMVELPFSILDRRLLESGLLRRARERGLMVFARSVYLQGLVFMDPDRLPGNLGDAKEALDNVHHTAHSHRMSIGELCLRYVLSVNGVTSLIVGADNLEQLKENIRMASLGPLDKAILKEIEGLPQMPRKLIDIRSWGQRYDFTRS